MEINAICITTSRYTQQLRYIVHFQPKLVRTTKKRFEKALRTLHELCMWGAKDGINRLRSLHKVYTCLLWGGGGVAKGFV